MISNFNQCKGSTYRDNFSGSHSIYVCSEKARAWKNSRRISTQIYSSQSNEETVNGNGKQTEPLLNSNISVSEAIQKPSFRRQASASTFLCPDYIPGMLYIYICLKVIYPKYYKQSNCTFLFLGRLGHLAKTEISAILRKFPTLGDVFSYFHGQNKYKIRVSCAL